nr:type I-E CRISPR-associated endoribonuclease Cas2e [Ardenticatena sp.]
MVVIILEAVPASVRGELTRWLLEPHPGVFVGHVSARVRDRLWNKCIESHGSGGVIQIWSTNTEQRFRMRMHGTTRRRLVEVEGLQLIAIPLVEGTPPPRESAQPVSDLPNEHKM